MSQLFIYRGKNEQVWSVEYNEFFFLFPFFFPSLHVAIEHKMAAFFYCSWDVEII